ncbi:hypothetical protein Q7P37_011395 [Cladosporium fusiforme]
MSIVGRCCGSGSKENSHEEPARPTIGNNTSDPEKAKSPSVQPKASSPKTGDLKGETGENKPIETTTDASKKYLVAKNLWQQAFDQLEPHIQVVLREHGFDGSGTPQGAKQSSDELIKKVNEKQEQVQEKQWGFPYKGKKVVFREYTTDIIGWLTKAGDIAVQFSPPQAAVPWGVLKGLMNIAIVDAEQMAALLQVTDRVVRVIDRGVVYESAYLRDEGADLSEEIAGPLEKSLTAMFTTALNVLAETIYLLGKNTFMRGLASLYNEGSVDKSLAQIDAEEQKVFKDAADCEAKRSKKADDRITKMLGKLNEPITRIDAGVRHLLRDVEAKDHLNMLEWISDIPYGRHHNRVKRNRTPGSGKWLLEDPRFREWDQDSTSSIFWLQGTPGTGKTYVTSAVVDYIDHSVSEAPEAEGFAYFYCSKEEEERRLPKEIFRSIVRQLSTTAQNPDRTQSKLYDLYQRCQEHKSKLSPEQYEEQILESLNIYPKTTIIIDALDESRQGERDYLIYRLTRFLTQAKGRVKIYLSSRPDPEVGHQLRHSRTVSVDITGDKNKADIERYVDAQVDRLCEITPSPVFAKMRGEIITKILARCDGMFQWATLMIQQISRCRVRSDVRLKLEEFPAALTEIYERKWGQIEAIGGTHRLFVERAVLWMMAVDGAIDSDLLTAAVRVDPYSKDCVSGDEVDEGTLVMFGNDFLALDWQQHVWCFSHPSVREFLEKRNGWYPSEAHFHVAVACLNFSVNYSGPIEPPAGHEQNIAQRTQQKDNSAGLDSEESEDISSSFPSYATKHMYEHAERAQDDDVGTLATLLRSR